MYVIQQQHKKKHNASTARSNLSASTFAVYSIVTTHVHAIQLEKLVLPVAVRHNWDPSRLAGWCAAADAVVVVVVVAVDGCRPLLRMDCIAIW